MVSVYDVKPNDLIKKAAQELRANPEFKAPQWAMFAKTGVHKERPPLENDWWQIRVAAVLRTVYTQGPVGVNRLRVKYGGRKNEGYNPETTKKGSGSVARKSLQQLEKAGFIKQVQKGQHKGRVVTPAGKKLLDSVAKQIASEKKQQ